MPVVIVALLAVLLAAAGCGRQPLQSESEPDVSPGNVPKLFYESRGITVAENDPEAYQQALETLREEAEKPSVGLEYKNDAYSTDGATFSCYIANPTRNQYDMYIDIYDETMTEELYLSGLIRPGNAFESLTLNRPLSEGTHALFVAFTQVKPTEGGDFAIQAQVIIIMDFHVGENA
ncbi:MAG: hypothetical protein IKO14_08770 [Oscillibacter sp.]|nr:hypothetical protein [Oscillibacter sp.]